MLAQQIKITKTQVGTREATGNNDGEVVKYLLSVGLGPGYPYCAAGPYWCFVRACKVLGFSTDSIPIPRTGSAAVVFNYAKQHGVLDGYSPRVGDLMNWRYDGKVTGHEEQIVQVASSGWVLNVAYNTTSGSGNQREGSGVYYRWRNYRHPLGRMKFRGFIGFTR